MLGDDYEVLNFGKGATTVMKCGEKPYSSEVIYNHALYSNPDIIVLWLGINDAKYSNWKKGTRDEFLFDYAQLIHEFRKLES